MGEDKPRPPRVSSDQKVLQDSMYAFPQQSCCQRNARHSSKRAVSESAVGVFLRCPVSSKVGLHPRGSPHLLLSQDALRAKRNQEAADREWRRKEKENAQKKVETEAKLRKSRLEQVAFKEHTLAVQVQRDRDEFERILR